MQIIQGLLIAAALIAIVLLLFVALGLLAFGIAADVMRRQDEWDVMTGKTAEQEQTVELLAVEAARKNGNTGLLYRIYKYVEFKKRARRKY